MTAFTFVLAQQFDNGVGAGIDGILALAAAAVALLIGLPLGGAVFATTVGMYNKMASRSIPPHALPVPSWWKGSGFMLAGISGWAIGLLLAEPFGLHVGILACILAAPIGGIVFVFALMTTLPTTFRRAVSITGLFTLAMIALAAGIGAFMGTVILIATILLRKARSLNSAQSTGWPPD